VADIQCRLDIPNAGGNGEGAALTVGQVFVLDCEGPWPEMKSEAVELRLDKENAYKLKLLKFEFTSKTQAQLTVTSYKAGQHQLKAVQVVDAEHSVVLGDLSFAVNSVINQQDPPKEPYGPFGPLILHLPIWYPLSVVLFFAALGSVFFYRWRRRRQKMKLLDRMRLNEYAMDPFFQFYQTARKLQRSYGFFSGIPLAAGEASKFVFELEQAYKIYLARKFQIPTLYWGERRTLRDLKRHHREFFNVFRLEVRKSLAEISRAVKAGGTMNEKDCQQLFDLLRKQVDQIDRWLKTHGGAA
jgi:hypothetical protein